MTHKFTTFLFLLSFLLSVNIFPVFSVTPGMVASVSSPDGILKVDLSLNDKGNLFYKVSKDNILLIQDSQLGMTLLSNNFLSIMSYSSSVTDTLNETYWLPSGKASAYTNNCHELTAVFKKLGAEMKIIFRVYNDGFAFRYEIPGQGVATYNTETTQVVVNNFEYSWAQKYLNDYSWYYQRRDWSQNVSQAILSTPLLIKSGDTYMLLTEAANYGKYATSQIRANADAGKYTFEPIGSISSPFPLVTPWRTMIIGDLPTIVESTMIENLNPSTSLADLSWIRSGKSSWDWGGEDATNSVGFAIAKRYIDYAHDMGWEYFTLDDGWQGNSADYTLKELVDYANSKSVGVILWLNQSWLQNDSTEMYRVLKGWKDLGIKGLKVDFWQDDSQTMMQKYDKLMAVTGELQLMVNLHGCTKPSGIRRKWPQLLTTEAVMGGEFYLFNPPMMNAGHNINLTMTRNVIGPMDYTPCDFARKKGRIQQTTSWAHQLALTVAYESGILDLVDNTQNYKNHIAESFLKTVPTAWDETKCLEAKPDSFITIARRKDNDWYVASLCASARILTLPLDFLNDGQTYYAYVYQDGDCKSEIKFNYIPGQSRQSILTIPLLASGGGLVRLSTSPDQAKPYFQKYEAESARTLGTKTNDPNNLASGDTYVASLKGSNNLKFLNVDVDEAGEYALSVYYMTNGDKSAYINVNNIDTLYYTFPSTEGYTGSYLGFMTIQVNLQKGVNTIEYGNKTDFAPNVDRITLLKIKASDVQSLPANKLTDQVRITSAHGGFNIYSEITGLCTVYDVTGKIVGKKLLGGDVNRFDVNLKGVYIVNIYADGESFSSKVVVR